MTRVTVQNFILLRKLRQVLEVVESEAHILTRRLRLARRPGRCPPLVKMELKVCRRFKSGCFLCRATSKAQLREPEVA